MTAASASSGRPAGPSDRTGDADRDDPLDPAPADPPPAGPAASPAAPDEGVASRRTRAEAIARALQLAGREQRLAAEELERARRDRDRAARHAGESAFQERSATTHERAATLHGDAAVLQERHARHLTEGGGRGERNTPEPAGAEDG